MALHFRSILPAELEECFLHDVASQLQLTGDSLRITNQRPFVFQKSLPDPLGLADLPVVHHRPRTFLSPFRRPPISANPRKKQPRR